MMRLLLSVLAAALSTAVLQAADPLLSWNPTPTKRALVAFVERTTTAGSPDFVTPAERIAVFDNDGTLWAEQPLYFQAFYIFDRVRQLAAEHPDWEEKEPFASVLRGDLKAALAGGDESLLAMVAATHAGLTTEEVSAEVNGWLATAKHPTTGRAYTEMVYQPMLELLDYLRANGFKTFIVSGGGIDFMRPWSERVYGIPPEQVIGSRLKVAYEVRDGKPVIVKLPEIDFIDDRSGKPVGIYQHLGRRPLMAFGNSDGDFEMLQWTTAGSGPRLGLLLHHTDADREWAYDRESPVGKLAKGLDEAAERGWLIVDMKRDWKQVFRD
jgi:phosphoglycolate phosphatase-like HAD superfamily hydrolase